MPFISVDSGNQKGPWVKTAYGWQSLSSSPPQSVLNDLFGNSDGGEDKDSLFSAPLKNVDPSVGTGTGSRIIFVQRRKKLLNHSLEDVMRKLEFCQAAGYFTRFEYICSFVELWFREKSSDSGFSSTQRSAFSLLHSLIMFVWNTEQGYDRVSQVLDSVSESLINSKNIMNPNYESLYEKQGKIMKEYKQKLEKFKATAIPERLIYPPVEDKNLLGEMPYHFLKQVVTHISSPIDLCNLSLVSSAFYHHCNDEAVWKKLAIYHFGSTEAEEVFTMTNDWKAAFKSLYLQRPPSMREGRPAVEMRDMVTRCNRHLCLFWKSEGSTGGGGQSCDCRCTFQDVSPSALIDIFRNG